MKAIFALLFFIPVLSTAQTVSGLYSGKLVNDSTQKIQNYEMALSEYRDKITGYSYTTFVVNDTFYYSIKRVKATKKGSELVVEDDKMLANNFPESPAKGVKQINTIPITERDTITALNGKWETTQTKKYYSLQGALDMKRDNDSSHSALIAHLTELRLINRATTQTTEVKSKTKDTEQKRAVSVKEKMIPKPTAIKESIPLPYNQRQQKIIQTLSISGDSLVLSFYDNGVVDGDVISAYLNDQNIISNVRLTGVAAKKTVYLSTINSDSIQLILVAENLGSLPPNTGLLVVQDGNNRYQVTFSADLQTNAAIVFRKKN
jgi:hypothetical protein